jgi:hypothetical protein
MYYEYMFKNTLVPYLNRQSCRKGAGEGKAARRRGRREFCSLPNICQYAGLL